MICKPSRRGVALMVVVVMFSIVTILLGVLALQMLANRRLIEQRHGQLQALWLARSGLAVAEARLGSGAKDYTGETIEVIPDGRVAIAVMADGDGLSIDSEASLGQDDSRAIRSSLQTRIVQ